MIFIWDLEPRFFIWELLLEPLSLMCLIWWDLREWCMQLSSLTVLDVICLTLLRPEPILFLSLKMPDILSSTVFWLERLIRFLPMWPNPIKLVSLELMPSISSRMVVTA